MVAIDMPIGLPNTGVRQCDLAAKVYLGPGRNRVFTGVRRPLLQHVDNFGNANLWAKKDGRGISIQLFCILPKIAELDQYLLGRSAAFPIRETHPELVFQGINNGQYLPQKKTTEGRQLRRDLIYAHGFSQIDDWLGSIKGTGAKADDLLDACACVIAAKSQRRIECAEEYDACGLPMEMWY
jgi:predicted RNase H-like nuclease